MASFRKREIFSRNCQTFFFSGSAAVYSGKVIDYGCSIIGIGSDRQYAVWPPVKM